MKILRIDKEALDVLEAHYHGRDIPRSRAMVVEYVDEPDPVVEDFDAQYAQLAREWNIHDVGEVELADDDPEYELAREDVGLAMKLRDKRDGAERDLAQLDEALARARAEADQRQADLDAADEREAELAGIDADVRAPASASGLSPRRRFGTRARRGARARAGCPAGA